MQRRVVVTGFGMVTPIGHDSNDCWQSLNKGASGIRRLDPHMPIFSEISSRIGGKIWDFDPSAYFTKKETRRLDPYVQYALKSSRDALLMAGISETNPCVDLERSGVMIGSGIGGLLSIETESAKLQRSGPSKISPFFIPASLANMASGHVSLESGFKGPNVAVVSACASGAHSIIVAAQQIELGYCDTMICGGAEHATIALGSSGFAAMRALSTRNDAPEQASRPWDKDRDGFVISDGAGVLILEAYETAMARKAPIFAELSGYGMSSDAYHMIQPAADGSGAARCKRQALQNAQLSPEAIEYINAHATSTPLGDEIEPIAIRRVFAEHADKLAVSSTKSAHGHMLGAAGAAEAIISILALQHQAVPGTLNCERPSSGCDLDFVREGMRSMRLSHVMSNSFGFGGTNASLIFSKI